MCLTSVAACGDASSSRGSVVVPAVDPTERFPGGGVTVDRTDVKAFSQSAPALDFAGEANFKSGNLLFRNTPAGLGPLFNTQACQGCHNQDGRGSPPATADEPLISMLLHLGIADAAAPDGVRPDPIYGDQLQPLGDGVPGEASPFIVVDEIPGAYPDGEPYVLHRPTSFIRGAAYGDLDPDVAWSPRVAPTMIGLGLLEAVSEADVLAHADPDDRDRDGISGRPNFADDILLGVRRLGRFGVKATQPSILQQAAGAYRGDIGATNSLYPTGPCTELQAACRERAAETDDGAPEIADVQLALVEFYSRHLAVPVRRGWDESTGTFTPEVLRGREVFHESGCAGCHVPSFRTGVAAGSLLGDVALFELTQPATPLTTLSEQTIWPYTDLLLHDMGGSCAPTVRETADGASCSDGPDCSWVRRCEGLADGLAQGEASGTEWRTPPLWGLGLVQVVNPRAGFLHDGRARTIEEAILWHDGEARAARDRFTAAGRTDRAALLAFLGTM
ncbi:thiol oxidoreductase [Candidatus Binatia bacterium]|nr:thiol oxidoreductase [Candidatus Binatia bacterium]